jgi:hypothetical protein
LLAEHDDLERGLVAGTRVRGIEETDREKAQLLQGLR